jgi:hypothetical protein
MGSGLRGFHVHGENERMGFSRGEEVWTYWTDGLLPWSQWERELQDIRRKTVAIELDGTWYMIDKSDLQGAQKFPNLMRNEMAKRLYVPVEELSCVKIDGPVDPMTQN